jgi:hypothetical protein
MGGPNSSPNRKFRTHLRKGSLSRKKGALGRFECSKPEQRAFPTRVFARALPMWEPSAMTGSTARNWHRRDLRLVEGDVRSTPTMTHGARRAQRDDELTGSVALALAVARGFLSAHRLLRQQ